MPSAAVSQAFSSRKSINPTASGVSWGFPGGPDSTAWSHLDASNIVWGVADNIVWGVAENIVWGV